MTSLNGVRKRRLTAKETSIANCEVLDEKYCSLSLPPPPAVASPLACRLDLWLNTDLIIACKAGVFCCAIDLDFLHTESWGESKDDSKGEVDASK